MVKKVRHAVWHLSKWSIRLITLSVVMSVILSGVFVWRITDRPLDISAIKPYLQAAMRDEETGSYTIIEKAVLYWPDVRGALYLEIEGGQVMSPDDTLMLSFGSAAISFSRYGLFTGHVMPKAIILKQPTVRLTRRSDGSFDFDLADRPLTKEENDSQSKLTTRIFAYIARPGYESANKSIISRLTAFSIRDARLLVNDEIEQQTWSLPDFDFAMRSTDDGMDAVVDVKFPDVGLDESHFHMDAKYLWDEKNIEISAAFENMDLDAVSNKIPELQSLSGQNIVFDAKLETILDETFLPTDVRVNVTSEKGSIVQEDMSDDPIAYSDLSINATYNYAGKSLQLSDTAVMIGGVPLNAAGQILHGDTGFTGDLELWINEVAQAKMNDVWPKALRGDDSEKWIVHRMSDGVFKDVKLRAGFVAKSRENTWILNINELAADFKCEGMTIDYRAPLQKATDVFGSGRFDYNTDELSIDVEKAKIGNINVNGGRVLLDKVVAVGEGDADLRLSLKGNVVDFIHYISEEPINLGDRIGMDLAKVAGDADLTVGLTFPAQKGVLLKDFKIDVAGTLRDVNFPDVVQDLDLSGGPMAFSIKDGRIKINGDAQLDKRPMKFSWETFLESEGKPYKEKVTANITADPNIRQRLGIDLTEFIEGSLPVEVVYTTHRDKSAQAVVSVDVTPALFFVEPFDFEKQPGEVASASFTANLKNGTVLNLQDLKAKGEGFSLSGADITFQQIDGETELLRGAFPGFALGETTGDLNFRFDEMRTAHINLNASFLDARPFMDAESVKETYDDPPMKITVQAQNVRTTKTQTVQNALFFMDIDHQGRFDRLEMDAHAGKGDIVVRFQPNAEGKRIFLLKTDDAGAFLKAFRVFDTMVGGDMIIYGEPIRGVLDRNILGKAQINNFKVVKEPAMTKILSILSLTGIGEALSNNGLTFSKLEVDFNWLYRKGGSLLVLKQGRTSGNALGLLFEGTLDNKKREVNMGGTIVPMSGLNKVLGKIPLVGDILTGGSGGIFAATYSIKGAADNPQVTVNPLSVLAPGIIRRILFE